MTPSAQSPVPVTSPNGESLDLPFLAPHMFDPRSGLELGERGLQWSAFAGKRDSGLLTAMHKRWGMPPSKVQKLASQYEAFGIDGAGAWLEINPERLNPGVLGHLMQDSSYSVQSLRLGALQEDGEVAFAYDTAWFHDNDESGTGAARLENQWLALVIHQAGKRIYSAAPPVGVLVFRLGAHHDATSTHFEVELSDVFVLPAFRGHGGYSAFRGRGGYARALAMGCAYVLSELLLIAHTVSVPDGSIEMNIEVEPIGDGGERIADMIYRQVQSATDRIRVQREDIDLAVYMSFI